MEDRLYHRFSRATYFVFGVNSPAVFRLDDRTRSPTNTVLSPDCDGNEGKTSAVLLWPPVGALHQPRGSGWPSYTWLSSRRSSSILMQPSILIPNAIVFYDHLLLLIPKLNSSEDLPSDISWASRGHRCRPCSPPRYFNSFLSRIGFQDFHCSSIFIESCLLTTLSRFPLQLTSYARKVPYEYVRSVIVEPTKLVLVGTRTSYQATGDAGFYNIY